MSSDVNATKIKESFEEQSDDNPTELGSNSEDDECIAL